jgi:hypothetical protein
MNPSTAPMPRPIQADTPIDAIAPTGPPIAAATVVRAARGIAVTPATANPGMIPGHAISRGASHISVQDNQLRSGPKTKVTTTRMPENTVRARPAIPPKMASTRVKPNGPQGITGAKKPVTAPKHTPAGIHPKINIIL